MYLSVIFVVVVVFFIFIFIIKFQVIHVKCLVHSLPLINLNPVLFFNLHSFFFKLVYIYPNAL